MQTHVPVPLSLVLGLFEFLLEVEQEVRMVRNRLCSGVEEAFTRQVPDITMPMSVALTTAVKLSAVIHDSDVLVEQVGSLLTPERT